jgi:hypothetical protein
MTDCGIKSLTFALLRPWVTLTETTLGTWRVLCGWGERSSTAELPLAPAPSLKRTVRPAGSSHPAQGTSEEPWL